MYEKVQEFVSHLVGHPRDKRIHGAHLICKSAQVYGTSERFPLSLSLSLSLSLHGTRTEKRKEKERKGSDIPSLLFVGRIRRLTFQALLAVFEASLSLAAVQHVKANILQHLPQARSHVFALESLEVRQVTMRILEQRQRSIDI